MTEGVGLTLKRDRVVLFSLGMSQLVYGGALVWSDHTDIWWPASLTSLLGISIHAWGWVWVVIGMFILLGVSIYYPNWRKRLYAPAAVLYVVWAIVAVLNFWSTAPHELVWGPAAIYLSFAVLVLALGWPDQWENHGKDTTDSI